MSSPRSTQHNRHSTVDKGRRHQSSSPYHPAPHKKKNSLGPFRGQRPRNSAPGVWRGISEVTKLQESQTRFRQMWFSNKNTTESNSLYSNSSIQAEGTVEKGAGHFAVTRNMGSGAAADSCRKRGLLPTPIPLSAVRITQDGTRDSNSSHLTQSAPRVLSNLRQVPLDGIEIIDLVSPRGGSNSTKDETGRKDSDDIVLHSPSSPVSRRKSSFPVSRGSPNSRSSDEFMSYSNRSIGSTSISNSSKVVNSSTCNLKYQAPHAKKHAYEYSFGSFIQTNSLFNPIMPVIPRLVDPKKIFKTSPKKEHKIAQNHHAQTNFCGSLSTWKYTASDTFLNVDNAQEEVPF